MILRIYDLTDLLGQLSNGPYWFVKRKHQGKWYYLSEYDAGKDSVIWSLQQDRASTMPEESTARQLAAQIGEHPGDFLITKEMLED